MENCINSLLKELELLLDGSAKSARESVLTRMERVTLGMSAIVLFGAGNLGRKTLAGLRRAGVEPLCFSDNNPALWGLSADGLKILPPPEAATRFDSRAAFVATIYTGRQVQKQLSTNGLTVVPFAELFAKYHDSFLPFLCLDFPDGVLSSRADVLTAMDLWHDDRSRQEYVEQIRYRVMMAPPSMARESADDMHLAPDLIKPVSDEVFIDCGAFDGDSIRSFMARRGQAWQRIVAIEPDPENFRRLTAVWGHVGFGDSQKNNRRTYLPGLAGWYGRL